MRRNLVEEAAALALGIIYDRGHQAEWTVSCLCKHVAYVKELMADQHRGIAMAGSSRCPIASVIARSDLAHRGDTSYEGRALVTKSLDHVPPVQESWTHKPCYAWSSLVRHIRLGRRGQQDYWLP